MAIDKVLDEFNLKRENLVGLGDDGCSTMLGEKRRLSIRLKETSPSLISFHFLHIRFNLLSEIFLKMYVQFEYLELI